MNNIFTLYVCYYSQLVNLSTRLLKVQIYAKYFSFKAFYTNFAVKF